MILIFFCVISISVNTLLYFILDYIEKGEVQDRAIKYRFCVPYYISEEIVDYVELTEKGYSKCMKWENIKLLLKLAVINDKLTKKQTEFIKSRYFRKYQSLQNGSC